MKNTIEGYIYVASNPVYPGVVKIGRTKNVDKRMKQLGTGAPEKYEVLHSELVINDSQVECQLHREFNNVRQKGEWFKISDIELVKRKINSIQKKIRYEGELEYGETTREKYENACNRLGVGGLLSELDGLIKWFEGHDADEIDEVIQKHAESLLDCYGEMDYI